MRESENHCICIPENIDQPAAVLKVTAGQTLRLHDKDCLKLLGLDHFQQIFHLWSGIDRLAGDDLAEDVFLRDRRVEVRGGILLDHLLVLAENFLHGHIRAVRPGLAEID